MSEDQPKYSTDLSVKPQVRISDELADSIRARPVQISKPPKIEGYWEEMPIQVTAHFDNKIIIP